jgi:streptothricin hydrolase
VAVVHVQDDGATDPLVARGTPGWELVLPVLDEDVVVAKAGDDAFDGTDLQRRLAELAVDTVVVVGIQSEMCVLATARAAQSRGLRVVLPRGGHATYDIPAEPPDVPAVPAAHVARVVEWALGDEVMLPPVDELDWLSA